MKVDLERRGMGLEDSDVAVAAHAAAGKATLVTNDVEHTGRVAGLRVES
jgi:predicted nucleic acid-binding protein